MAVFVVDTNFFIDAYRRTYPPDVVPGFWPKVQSLAEEGKILSIDKVLAELERFEGGGPRDEMENEPLEHWCRRLPESFFRETESMLETTYKKVVHWAADRTPKYRTVALRNFFAADNADAFLIAYALTEPESYIVTTLEVPAPHAVKKIKIPDVCAGLGIRWCDTISMFRSLGETF
jgi:hypothetical protein